MAILLRVEPTEQMVNLGLKVSVDLIDDNHSEWSYRMVLELVESDL